MPAMDRSSAVSHLLNGTRAGRFVVRGSNKVGFLALTVVKPGGADVWHARIKNLGGHGQAAIQGYPPFESLDQMILVTRTLCKQLGLGNVQ